MRTIATVWREAASSTVVLDTRTFPPVRFKTLSIAVVRRFAYVRSLLTGLFCTAGRAVSRIRICAITLNVPNAIITLAVDQFSCHYVSMRHHDHLSLTSSHGIIGTTFTVLSCRHSSNFPIPLNLDGAGHRRRLHDPNALVALH